MDATRYNEINLILCKLFFLPFFSGPFDQEMAKLKRRERTSRNAKIALKNRYAGYKKKINNKMLNLALGWII